MVDLERFFFIFEDFFLRLDFNFDLHNYCEDEDELNDSDSDEEYSLSDEEELLLLLLVTLLLSDESLGSSS